MDRPYLVLIQPQVHNGAVETRVKQKTDAVRQKKKPIGSASSWFEALTC